MGEMTKEAMPVFNSLIYGAKANQQFSNADAAISQGYSVQAGKEAEARQMIVAAGGERAKSQRQMASVKREGDLLESAAVARAAAMGAGSDPTIVNHIADIAAEKNYRMATALYGGQSLSEQYKAAAEMKRYEGQQYAQAGKTRGESDKISGYTTLGMGAFNMLDKYGERGGGGDAFAKKIDKPSRKPSYTPFKGFDSMDSFDSYTV